MIHQHFQRGFDRVFVNASSTLELNSILVSLCFGKRFSRSSPILCSSFGFTHVFSSPRIMQDLQPLSLQQPTVELCLMADPERHR